ncbi:MAG TPA: hypothetical protein VLH09_06890 [Bryobacteraceae bacterium]|nr:hypothetical protein [Bryobacteraceae bacterium]
MGEDHDGVLLALYERRPPPIPLGELQRRRWQFECDRRMLDVARLLWKRWPLTSLVGEALDEEYAIHITRQIPALSPLARDLPDAVRLGLARWAAEMDHPFLEELRRLESAKAGDFEPTREARPDEAAALGRPARILEVSCNILAAEKILSHYARVHAPRSLIRNFTATPGPRRIAFYDRGAKRYLSDISCLQPAVGE